ncbi:MAG: D-cysteine desulfhydrase family protein [Caldilineaceae bacterium]|nr:D-cysteine desulfhydrase family protein [Caldilineaceae bacterium]HRJ40666.1 D-cysteine desulfhydrase family protein [Caldilineaceae bacterium]
MNDDPREEQLSAAIAALPRYPLGWLQTPLEAAPRLSAALGGPPIFIKRDDLTGLSFGGNKTRMLEFSIADAQAKGADTIVYGAAVQSNYCRQLAGACAKAGYECHLLMRPEREMDKTQITGNGLVQRLLGAHVTVLPDNDRPSQQAAIQAKAAELRAAGKQVYIPRQPDTVDLEALAYAVSALEVVQQARAQGIEPKWLYVAAADTTQAGLVLGLKAIGSGLKVRGINPSFNNGNEERMAVMANQAAERLDLDVSFTAADFDNDDSYVGERYGVPTAEGLAAVAAVAQNEGILLDPVYTGKAMSGLIDHIRSGKIGPDEPVIFLHTGGAPALFGYAEEMIAALAG